MFNEINSNITGRKIDNNGTYTTVDNNKVYTIHDFKLSGNVSSIAYSSSDGREFASNNATAYGNGNNGLNKNGYNAVGAFAGTTNAREANKFIFSNVELNDVRVRGTKYAGGLIGYVFQKGETYSETVINNISSSSLDVSSAISAGGLIGYTNSKITINGDYNSSGCNSAIGIKNVYNFASFANSGDLTVGGLIGTALIADGMTRETQINNIDVTGSNDKAAEIGLKTFSTDFNNQARVGGFIGRVGETELSVNACNVKRTNLNGGLVGGYFGYIYFDKPNITKTHNITNCTLDADSKIVSIKGTRCVGGIFGYDYSKNDGSASNICVDTFKVINYELESVSANKGADNRNVGDEIYSESPATVNMEFDNISVSGSTIKSNYTGEDGNGRQGTGLLMGCIRANNGCRFCK